METGNNQGFDFGEQGNKAIYLMGTREQVPRHWEGLTMEQNLDFFGAKLAKQMRFYWNMTNRWPIFQ